MIYLSFFKKEIRLWTGFGTPICRTFGSQSSINISSYFILIYPNLSLVYFVGNKNTAISFVSQIQLALSISLCAFLYALFSCLISCLDCSGRAILIGSIDLSVVAGFFAII
jgi:hypothetical protein